MARRPGQPLPQHHAAAPLAARPLFTRPTAATPPPWPPAVRGIPVLGTYTAAGKTFTKTIPTDAGGLLDLTDKLMTLGLTLGQFAPDKVEDAKAAAAARHAEAAAAEPAAAQDGYAGDGENMTPNTQR